MKKIKKLLNCLLKKIVDCNRGLRNKIANLLIVFRY